MPDYSLAEEPTCALIDRHYRRLSEIWSNARRQWDTYDSYYKRTYSVWEGNAARKRPGWLKPAKPTSVIDHAVDHQMAANPKYHRWPTKDSDEAKQAADRVEVAMDAMAMEQALLEPVLTWKGLGKNLIHLGYAVLETGMDTTILQKRRADPIRTSDMDDDEWKAVTRLYEHYRRTAMPFRTRVPHPARILLDPWEKRPRVAIRHFKRFAVDIADMVHARKLLGKKTGDFEVRNNNPFEEFVVDEWWTEYYHAYQLSGFMQHGGSQYTYNSNQRRMLFVDRNTWGFVPYAHAFAGFGQEPTLASKVDPMDMAVGLLDPIMADLKAQAQQVSARHNAVMEASFEKVGTSALGADELRDQLDEGDIIEAPMNSIWRMEKPNHPRWMFQHGSELESDIEDGTFSRQISGQKLAGVNTVGQQAILMNASGKKFVAPARQMEHLASVNGSHQLQLIDLLDLDLTVRGNRIKSKDLDSDYSISATFDVVDPVIQFQNRQQGLMELQAGAISLDTFWERDAHLEDSSGERRRLLEDYIRRNPLIHQELAMEVAREMGIEEIAERAIERAKQKAPGGPPRGAPNGNGSAIIGPDGQPMDRTMGTNGGPADGAEQLNMGLTADVLNPNRAGVMREG